MNQVEAFNEHRPLLLSIAYRMSGSVMDAEDLVQDTFVRWQQVPGDDVASPKSYLSTVVTRLCIDHLRSARVRREEYIGPWLPEPLIMEDQPDMADRLALADSLSTAFLVLLEQLRPVERAAFLLREVFDYDYAEIARIIEKSEANCRQLVSRARKTLRERRPRFDASQDQAQELTKRFMEAALNGDMDGLLAMLAEDVTVWSDGGGKVVAALNPISGADKAARFLLGLGRKAPAGLITQLRRINGLPGIINYIDGAPQSVGTLDVIDGKIAGVYVVLNPDKLQRVPHLARSGAANAR